MIFQDELIKKILAGEKTVTRRPVKYDEAAGGSCELVALPCKYKVGRDYALQGPPEKGSKARARTIPGYRLQIIATNSEPLRNIEWREARREGFANVAAFLRYWRKLYGSVDMNQEVWRIEFELVPDEGEGGDG